MLKLTIAVPTYNRNALLLASMHHLLPQMTQQCCLVIVDNHSTVPVEETMKPLFERYPIANCRIVRNAVNVGGNANILRCFEICNTEWLWILGDDDRVLDDAISTIFEQISAHPEIVYANFASEILLRSNTFTTHGLENFAAGIDSFSNVLLISTSLYNSATIKPHLRHGYHYAYSCATQMLVVMRALGEQGRCVFSERRIISWVPAPADRQWSLILAYLGFTTLLEADLNPRTRRLLAEKILAECPRLRSLTLQLYYLGRRKGEFETSKYLFDHLTYRLYYHRRGAIRWIKVRALRQVLCWPWLFSAVYVLASNLLGKRTAEVGNVAPNVD